MAFTSFSTLQNIQRYSINNIPGPTVYSYVTNSGLTYSTGGSLESKVNIYTVLTFDISGTLTFTNPPPMINYFIVGGGGGGGGGGGVNGANINIGGNAGNGGQILTNYLSTNTNNYTININIGAGGAGGAGNTGNAGTAGTAGGSTILTIESSTITCVGGKGGNGNSTSITDNSIDTNSKTGGRGGGDLKSEAGQNGPLFLSVPTKYYGSSGSGGSRFAVAVGDPGISAGKGGTSTTTSAGNGTFYGCSGGGGGAANGQGAKGGNGFKGCVLLYWNTI